MTNAGKACCLLFICLVTTVCTDGWDSFNDIHKVYKNIFDVDRNPSSVPDQENSQNPQNVFRYGHQSNPFYNPRGDLEYNNRIQQQYIEPILRQLQELLYNIKSWYVNQPRYPPQYMPYPASSYPKREYAMPFGVSSGPDVSHRFPAMEDSNQNWGIVTEDEPNNKTDIKSNCSSTSDMARMSNYMTSIDTPTRCKAATLSCCVRGYSYQERKECFTMQRCLRSFETGYACLPIIVKAVYVELYG